MTLTKELPILDSTGVPVDDFQLIVVGAMHYPNCVASMFHFRDIIASDAALESEFSSELAQTVRASIRRRKLQGDVAGQVALRMLEMRPEIETAPSVNKACHLVASSVQERTVDGKPFKPRTADTIRKAFYEYKPSCHLWAAVSIAPDDFSNSYDSPEAMFRFLAVAGMLQGALRIIMQDPRSPWEPWGIPLEFGHPENELHMYGMTESMKETLSGYVAAKR